ncbi:MAG: glycosyltransferase [Phycisphaeraceae bacterium]|nr:glycosyltransferase [Phycisphaeraceae bacterium]
MHSFICVGLLVIWVLWVVQAILATCQVAWFAGKFLRRRSYDFYRPRAWVIVPFKGLEKDLGESIRCLCTQNYEDYKLLAVVESSDDPAFAVLEKELAAYGARAELVVAGLAPPTCSQKLHNQLAALTKIEADVQDDDVYVFADSDAVPGLHWLGSLVGPLCRTDKYGLTTGYRWLVPQPAVEGQRSSLWSNLASVINSSVACQLGRTRLNFAWGGSMALRVATARRGAMKEKLERALTDDYPMSTMCRTLGLKIAFVPRCLVASAVTLDRPAFWNFGHRQYLITRVYAPFLYGLALSMLSFYALGWATAAVGLLAGLMMDSPCWPAWVPAGALLTVWLADQVRTSFRQGIVERAFGSQHLPRLRGVWLLERWATPLYMGVHWLLVLSALRNRTMSWRGNRYQLRGPYDVQRLP